MVGCTTCDEWSPSFPWTLTEDTQCSSYYLVSGDPGPCDSSIGTLTLVVEEQADGLYTLTLTLELVYLMVDNITVVWELTNDDDPMSGPKELKLESSNDTYCNWSNTKATVICNGGYPLSDLVTNSDCFVGGCAAPGSLANAVAKPDTGKESEQKENVKPPETCPCCGCDCDCDGGCGCGGDTEEPGKKNIQAITKKAQGAVRAKLPGPADVNLSSGNLQVGTASALGGLA